MQLAACYSVDVRVLRATWVPPVQVKEDNFTPEEVAELLNISTSEVMSKIISAPAHCLETRQLTIWSGLKYRNKEWLQNSCTASVTIVTNLLYSLGWPCLETRRSYLKLNSTYKILNNLITTLKPTLVGMNTISNTSNATVIHIDIPFSISNNTVELFTFRYSFM